MKLTLTLLLSVLLLGCTTSDFKEYEISLQASCDAAVLTQVELDECYKVATERAEAKAEYERANRRLLEREKIKAYIKSCESKPSQAIVYVCRVCSGVELKRWHRGLRDWQTGREIGRASCRERV